MLRRTGLVTDLVVQARAAHATKVVSMFQLILLLPAAAEICCRHHAGGQRAPPSAGTLSDGLLAGALWQNTPGVTRPLISRALAAVGTCEPAGRSLRHKMS